MPSRLLRTAALVELVSLALLLINLATVHRPAVAALLGPIHGCAYLFVIGATIRESRATPTRLRAIVPGIGGLLVLQRLKTPVVAHDDRRTTAHDNRSIAAQDNHSTTAQDNHSTTAHDNHSTTAHDNHSTTAHDNHSTTARHDRDAPTP
jgi:hypothetical protein